MMLFGNIPVDGVETPSGFKRLGIESVPPLLGRGVLLDIAGWKGQGRLPPKCGISDSDMQDCAAAQKVEVRGGDVLLVRTGYGDLWHDEPAYLQAAGVSKSANL